MKLGLGNLFLDNGWHAVLQNRLGLTLELDFVLNDERLALVINGLGELRRNCMMGGGVLDNESLVAFHTLEDGGLLDCPLADVGPLLFLVSLRLLLGVGWLPSSVPTVGKLFQEIGLDRRRLGEVESLALRFKDDNPKKKKLKGRTQE